MLNLPRIAIAALFIVPVVLAWPAHAQPSPDEPQPFQEGSWTIVLMPDTQKYVDLQEKQQYLEVFTAMSQWIVEQKEERNIQLMIHLGDIVDNNTPEEWAMAKQAISILDNQVPYILVGGNHDYGPNGSSSNRTTLMNQYFRVSDNALNDPRRGGITKDFFEAGKLDNTYSTFTAPDGRKMLIFGLEFAPRKSVVDWAKRVAQHASFRDHTAILVTHAYMEEGPRDESGAPTAIRSNWAKYGPRRAHNPHSYGLAKDGKGNQLTGPNAVHDGEELWQNLVSQVDNFQLTLNGHYLDDNDSNTADGGPATTAMQVDTGSAGQNVYQMVANYQQLPNGGDGYMRLLEFLPDGKTVVVKTYSPTRNRWLNDPNNYFTIELSPISKPTDSQ